MREVREMGFRYAGMEKGDAQVGGQSCGGGGGGRRNMSAGEAVHWTEKVEGRAGLMSKLRNNKQWSLGPEWSMYEVGTPPPHNLYKPH